MGTDNISSRFPFSYRYWSTFSFGRMAMTAFLPNEVLTILMGKSIFINKSR